MARTAIKLEEEENMYFHMNYAYMWKKLNTAPYYVSGSGEIPKWIRDPWLLPSYANLSKCLGITYMPSMNIVNKIVQFYNANIKPEIDTYAFLHEKLEASDNVRTTSSGSDASPYCGVYHCYYYAGIASKKEIYGAILKIQKVHDTTSVQLITGLTTDNDLNSAALRDLFISKDISVEQYTQYRDGLDLAKRRTSLYKGIAELAPGMMTLQLQSEDHANGIIVLRMPLADSVDGHFLGSLGLLTLISGNDLQILKVGIVRADLKGIKPFSMKDEQLRSILAIEKLPNEHIQISFNENSQWNEMILSAAE